MEENQQERNMTVSIPRLSDFIGSVWAKILAVLTAASIIVGIIIELQSLVTGFYTLKKTVADSCISRVESAAKNMRMSDAMSGNYGEDDDFDRDCDPNYARHQATKACNKKFKAIFDPVMTFGPYDKRLSEFSDTLEKKLKAFEAECTITSEDKDIATTAYSYITTVITPKPIKIETPPTPPVQQDMIPLPAVETPSLPAPSTPAAPAPSPPPPEVLRMPQSFHCENATLGVDYVICSSPQLMDLEAQLEDVYKAVRAAKGDGVKIEQRVWSKRYGPDCGLPSRGRPTAEKIKNALGCVQDAMEKRIRELQAQL